MVTSRSADDISARFGREPTLDGGRLRWWARDLTSPQAVEVATLAGELGLVEARRLHQLRRPLPYEGTVTAVPCRSFDPERDVEAWLDVNNRAFSFHPDQGGWTVETLRARMAEPWFDAGDFLVHDGSDGRLDGFCWTKLHPGPGGRDDSAERSAWIGEIYVIAAAPERHGTGLGSSLTVAGLDHLWHRYRPPVGMLYVESDNHPALRAYRRLGFSPHTDDVAFEMREDR